MRLILIPTSDAVLAANKFICEQGGNPHNCNEIGKVESAISTAFYPGTYPFAHGGLTRIAGALVAITFLNQHGLDLKYPLDEEKNINELAEIIEKCASSEVTIDQLQNWFEIHKTFIEN